MKRQGPDYHRILESLEYLPKKANTEKDSGLGYYRLMAENDENILYLNSSGQYFENLTNGKNSKYSFTLASNVNSNFYVGASINSFNIENFQKALLEENNNEAELQMIQDMWDYIDSINTENFKIRFIHWSRFRWSISS